MGVLIETVPAPEPQGPRLIRLADLLAEAEADARELFEAKKSGRARGPVTNLTLVDREIGGALFPGVHIIHGVPGAGKSAFGLQVAASCGCPALYVTCEMRPLVLLKRQAARVTETFLSRFFSGELAPDVATSHYRRGIAGAPYLAILDATVYPADLRTIFQAAESTRRLSSDRRHQLVILDSLHTFADAMPGEAAEYERLNFALAGLRNLSARLCCPVLAIAERNRVAMVKGGLNAGAGTRKIEYGAETVFDLDSDSKESEDVNGEKAIKLRIAKNRNGTAGKEIHLLFNGALQRFKEDAQ